MAASEAARIIRPLEDLPGPGAKSTKARQRHATCGIHARNQGRIARQACDFEVAAAKLRRDAGLPRAAGTLAILHTGAFLQSIMRAGALRLGGPDERREQQGKP